MKVHEYQAKALMARYGIPVPRGQVVSTAEEAQRAAEGLGGACVVKAQVYAGGRGKAGGVKVVGSAREARDAAAGMLGRRLVTHQTGPEGVPVHRVLVEAQTQLARELFVAVTMDRSKRRPAVIASASGGMDIEKAASADPGVIHTLAPDPVTGFQPFQGRRLAYALGLDAALVRPFSELLVSLYRLFMAEDASMVEVNPLGIDRAGKFIALDGKVNLDDNAHYRHPEWDAIHDPSQEDPLELEATKHEISYVTLGGDVGCLVNGAGLAMATVDLVNMAGARPANFLDVGGGAEETKVARAVRIMLSDPKVTRVLINVFGGILRCDQMATGVVTAVTDTGRRDVPIIARMLGTNAEQGKRILMDAGLQVTYVQTLDEVVEALQRK